MQSVIYCCHSFFRSPFIFDLIKDELLEYMTYIFHLILRLIKTLKKITIHNYKFSRSVNFLAVFARIYSFVINRFVFNDITNKMII